MVIFLKEKIRKNTLEKMSELSKNLTHKKNKENSILSAFFSTELWLNSNTVGVTLSTEVEFDTTKIIERGLQENKLICIPKVLPNRKMVFHYYNFSEELERSKFGLLEPVNNKKINKRNIDLIIVPGVAFHKSGYRVGFGGGISC